MQHYSYNPSEGSREGLKNQGYCEYCKRNTFWKPKKQSVTVEEQGIYVTFRRLFAVCMACGHEVTVPEFTERNNKLIADKVKLALSMKEKNEEASESVGK